MPNVKRQKKLPHERELHCPSCGRFLGFEWIVQGQIRLLCPKCKEWIDISIGLDENILYS